MTGTETWYERLGVRYPIVQAPLGGVESVALVAAVAEAGALGMLGAAYLTPEQLRAALARIRDRTDKPFGVNLFVSGRPPGGADDAGPMLEIVNRFHAELGLPPAGAPEPVPDPFEAQLAVVLEHDIPFFSFVFGIPRPEQLAALRARGTTVFGTATNVEEARLLVAAGVDGIVAQGSEAGGHRATFAGPAESGLIGTLALVPQIVDAVDVPVIASGGIMDGRGIVAAEALGAAGVQLGTLFLIAHESGVAPAYRAALREAEASETVLTRAFSGRTARGVANRFTREVGAVEDAILPFPLQNALTRPLRTAASARGDADFLSLWAGQGVPLARDLPAAELVARLVHEADAVRARLGRSAER